MSIQEAIQFMNCGRKLNNIDFSPGIPLYMTDDGIIHDDNKFNHMTIDEFFNEYSSFQDGWYIS